MERDREWEVAELGVAVDEVNRKKRKTKARRKNNGGFDLLLHDIVWFFLFFFLLQFLSLCFLALASAVVGFLCTCSRERRSRG